MDGRPVYPSTFGHLAQSVFGQYRAVVTTFFEQNPDLKGKVNVHHAIEQQVLRKEDTKDLFTIMEIHAYSNLRGIPNELNPSLHLSTIRKEWNRFYEDVPNPTREDFIRKAQEIDEKYGQLFTPPVKNK